MHLDPKALNAACYAFFNACRDGGARAIADEPSLIRNLNVSLALEPAIRAYLSASLPADVAEMVDRLRGPLAISGEHRDEAASLIQSQAARIAELEEGLVDVTASLVAAHSLLSRSSKKAAASDKMFDQMLADYRASIDRARALLNKRVEG